MEFHAIYSDITNSHLDNDDSSVYGYNVIPTAPNAFWLHLGLVFGVETLNTFSVMRSTIETNGLGIPIWGPP